MFAEDFNAPSALAATACPRCHVVGLVEIEYEEYADTAPLDKHQAGRIVDPSTPAKCPACGLTMEWPGCLPG